MEELLIEQMKNIQNYDHETIISFLKYLDNLINSGELITISPELLQRIYEMLNLKSKNGETLSNMLLTNSIMNNAPLSPTLLLSFYLTEKKKTSLDTKTPIFKLTSEAYSEVNWVDDTISFNYYHYHNNLTSPIANYNYQLLEEIFSNLEIELLASTKVTTTIPYEQLALSDLLMYDYLKSFVDSSSLHENMLCFYNTQAKAKRKTLNFAKRNNIFMRDFIKSKETELQDFYTAHKDARAKYHHYLRQISASLKPASMNPDVYRTYKERQNKINRVIINEEEIIAKTKSYPASYELMELGISEYTPVYGEDDLITFLNSVKMTETVYGAGKINWLLFLINGDTSVITRENGARESIEMLNYRELQKPFFLKIVENITTYLLNSNELTTDNPLVIYLCDCIASNNLSTMHILECLKNYIFQFCNPQSVLEVLENNIQKNNVPKPLDPKIKSFLPKLLNNARVSLNLIVQPEIKEPEVTGPAKTYLEAVNATINKHGGNCNWIDYLQSGNLKVITTSRNARSSLNDLDYHEIGDEMVLLSLENILNYIQNSKNSHVTTNNVVNKIITVFGRKAENYSDIDFFGYCKRYILNSDQDAIYELFTNNFSSLASIPKNTPLTLKARENISKVITAKRQLMAPTAKNTQNASKLDQEKIRNSTLKSRFHALSEELDSLLTKSQELDANIFDIRKKTEMKRG